MRKDQRPRIVMLGTAPNSRGGMTGVVDAYREGGLFDAWPVEYLSTYFSPSWRSRAYYTTTALARFLWLLVTGRVIAVHVHCASRGSFWRKSLFILPAFITAKPVL